jgi:hypothetical protein
MARLAQEQRCCDGSNDAIDGIRIVAALYERSRIGVWIFTLAFASVAAYDENLFPR